MLLKYSFENCSVNLDNFLLKLYDVCIFILNRERIYQANSKLVGSGFFVVRQLGVLNIIL